MLSFLKDWLSPGNQLNAWKRLSWILHVEATRSEDVKGSAPGHPQILYTDEIKHNLMEVIFVAIAVTSIHKKIDWKQDWNTANSWQIFLTQLNWSTWWSKCKPRRPEPRFWKATDARNMVTTRTFATAPLRYVKCGQQHISYPCKYTRNTAVTCVNCVGPHPANSMQC